jgi:DNA-binding MarR family transcriptional regulator
MMAMFDTDAPNASASEVSVAEVSWRTVASSRGLPRDRLAIGQLLGRLLHQFRAELFAEAQADGQFADIRFPHLQVWGNVGIDGIRLTDLAAKAQLSLAACSELVDELQHLGYLARRPDPSDGRAKLIFPTPKGREALDAAGRAVGELEQRWRKLLPRGDFDSACRTLQALLVALEVVDDRG